jgi:hypothetical protein
MGLEGRERLIPLMLAIGLFGIIPLPFARDDATIITTKGWDGRIHTAEPSGWSTWGCKGNPMQGHDETTGH